MKKRLLAVLVLSSLALTFAAPVALAQDATAVDGEAARGVDVQYVDCSQVASAFQNQYGSATAIDDGAAAEVANEQNITIGQVNACLGEFGQDGGGDGGPDNTKNGEDEANELEEGEKDVLAGTIPKVASLPNTGGPSLLAIAGGLALVACGASLIGFSVRR